MLFVMELLEKQGCDGIFHWTGEGGTKECRKAEMSVGWQSRDECRMAKQR